MTATSQTSPAKVKSSIPDKLATLSGFCMVVLGFSAVGSGMEGTADAYLRTISLAGICIAVAVVSLALRAAEKGH